MPIDAALIHKIALLAGDERGDPHTREIALNKLVAFRETHAHPVRHPGGDQSALVQRRRQRVEGLTPAARRLTASTLAELNRLGVAGWLDDNGRARFRSVKTPPGAAALDRDARLLEQRDTSEGAP